MPQNVYEALFLFDSNQFAKDRSALPKTVEDMITKGGGEVLVSRLWEERKLAYSIGGNRKGTYWLIYFRNDGQLITPLNRQCEINDGILRQLIIKIHPKLVEPILAHAEGRQLAEDAPAEDAPAEDAPAEGAPAEDAPTKEAAAENPPVEAAASEQPPAEDAPAEAPAPEEVAANA